MREDIFLFDHEAFIKEASHLIKSVDAGEFHKIIRKAEAIRDRIKRGKWILEGLGTGINELETSKAPWLIGFAFLVLLSQYLKPVQSRRILGQITPILNRLGWIESDIRLLTEGMSTTFLIKPELAPDPLERPSASDERWHDLSYYWWCIRPANAFSTGWLDYGHVEQFYEQLRNCMTALEDIDLSLLVIPTKSLATRQEMMKDLTNIIALLEDALENNTGLFYIVS